MTDREIFRQNLSDLMNVTKAKQIDIAKYAEVSFQTVSAWVCGRGYPNVDAMEKLCKFFGVRKSALTEPRDPARTQEDTLLDLFRAMSPEGKLKMLERAEEMKRLYPMRRMRKNAETEKEK